MNPASPKRTLSPATLAWILSLLLAGLWVVVAAAYVLWPLLRDGTASWQIYLIAGFMLLNAALILWLGHGLRLHNPLRYYLTLGYAALNVLFTFFDQIGLADLIYLLFSLLLFLLLLFSRKRFIQQA
jgi:hypothetical protein